MPDGVNLPERFSLLLPFDCKNSSFLSIISGNPRKQRYDEVNLFGIYAPFILLNLFPTRESSRIQGFISSVWFKFLLALISIGRTMVYKYN